MASGAVGVPDTVVDAHDRTGAPTLRVAPEGATSREPDANCCLRKGASMIGRDRGGWSDSPRRREPTWTANQAVSEHE